LIDWNIRRLIERDVRVKKLTGSKWTRVSSKSRTKVYSKPLVVSLGRYGSLEG
jgi:hypothetical protein